MLVTHRRLSVLTHKLATNLLNFNITAWLTTCKTWNNGGGPFKQAWTDLPLLFHWFLTQVCLPRSIPIMALPQFDTTPRTSDQPCPIKGLYDRHLVWGTELETYFLDEHLSDLLAFATYPNLLWDLMRVWLLLNRMCVVA